MGVKPGYKQTEIGVIPEDWGLICYADYLNIISGIGFKKSEYCDIGIRLLRIDNVSYGQISWDSIAYLPFQYTKKFPNLVLLEGDILLALNRPITSNQLKLARMNAEDSPAILYQRVGKIEVINRKLNEKFAYFVLRKYVRKFVEESSVGSDQPFVSTTKLKKICIPLPPLPEQTVIATALSDADALIQSLERLIAKKRDIKQGAMQELLTGKKRLPGFEKKKGYKQTEVGVIPEEWDVIQLKDVADKITVGFVGSMAYLFRSGGVPLLRGQNVLPHRLDLSDIKYISIDTHRLWKKSSLRPKDVVMVRVGYPGTSCVIPNNLGDANAASLVVVRPTTKKLNPDFFCYVVNSGFGRRQIDSYLVGGAQQVLNTTTAAIFLLPLPILSEQTAIATTLSDMDAEIAELDSKVTKARQIKQGMMQELLTGRIRLT